jgi:hypothetical protein
VESRAHHETPYNGLIVINDANDSSTGKLKKIASPSAELCSSCASETAEEIR